MQCGKRSDPTDGLAGAEPILLLGFLQGWANENKLRLLAAERFGTCWVTESALGSSRKVCQPLMRQTIASRYYFDGLRLPVQNRSMICLASSLPNCSAAAFKLAMC